MSEKKSFIGEPWKISLIERIERVEEAKKNGKKIALYFVKGPDSSTFRYRCYNIYQITQSSKKWQAVFFFSNEIAAVKKIISDCDLLVFGRQSRWNRSVKKVFKLAKKNNMQILFDLDDLVFDKKYLKVVVNSINESSNASYWISYFNDINKTAKMVDGFLVTNDFLGNKLKESFNKSYYVIRNSLNSEQLKASEDCVKEKNKKKQSDSFTVGYFSGSPTHDNDLETVVPEILELIDNYPEINFMIVGHTEILRGKKELIEEERIKFIPSVDFVRLQYLMSEVDVNIAPLVINDFTNCKSELKFFEAAAVETTTIASPTYAFKKAIKDGENGFLAQPGEWYKKIEYLYKNPDQNRKIAKKAREYALKHYYGKEFLKEVEEAYDYFAK